MSVLRKIFFLGHIYSRHTMLAIALDAVLLGLALWGASMIQGTVAPGQWQLLLVPAAVAVYFVLRDLVLWYLVAHRTSTGAYQLSTSPMESKFAASATHAELNIADDTRTLLGGDDWRLFDARYDFYRRTKYGTYLGRQAYYTVFEIRLRRAVPHLLFDSKRAKGRQFRYRYAGSQRLSLEGDFDMHFETYAPNYYKIDVLSFITPEVMLAFTAAADYDIELLEDRLFVYGPLLDRAEFPAIQAAGQRLAAALNDNLDTYRDSYLSGPERTTHTTQFARRLQKSPMSSALLAFGGAAALVVLAVLGATVDSSIFWNETTFFIAIWSVVSGVYAVQIVLDNHRSNRDFLAGPQPPKAVGHPSLPEAGPR